MIKLNLRLHAIFYGTSTIFVYHVLASLNVLQCYHQYFGLDLYRIQCRTFEVLFYKIRRKGPHSYCKVYEKQTNFKNNDPQTIDAKTVPEEGRFEMIKQRLHCSTESLLKKQ